VQAFETALKDKCNYTGTQPYWDWRINSDNYFNDFVFSSSSTTGFGGNGDPNNDYQITDGAFVEDFKRFYPVPNNIRRNFTQFPFDPAVPANYSFNATAIETLVSGHVGDFVSFQDYFENHAVNSCWHTCFVQFSDESLGRTWCYSCFYQRVCLLFFH
jgi:tyrosinase